MIRIIRWAHLFSKGALSASERREVRYSVGPFGFLKRGDLSTVLSSPPSPLPPTSAFSAMSDGKFSADLVVELVPLPTSASSAMSLTLTSSRLIWLWSFWASRWVVRLTCLSPGWNVDRNWWDVDRNWWDVDRNWWNCLKSLVFYSLPSSNALKIDTRAQSHKSYYSQPATVMGSELSWAFQPHLVNLLNNRVSPLITLLLSTMFSDNGKLSDDLFGYALDLAVVVQLSLLKPWINIDRSW